MELERLLKLEDVVDMTEVTRLRGELLELRSVKSELEKSSASLKAEIKGLLTRFLNFLLKILDW